MATPVEVEGEDHLRRLVQQHDTVIVSCFPSGKDVDSEQDLHQELTSNVTVLRRTSLNTVRAAGLLLPDDQEDDEKLHQEVWWLFFRGGEMVRAVPACVKCLYSSSHRLLRVPPRFKFNESIVPGLRTVGRMPTIITLSQGIHKGHLGCLRNFDGRPFSCVERAWEILYTQGVQLYNTPDCRLIDAIPPLFRLAVVHGSFWLRRAKFVLLSLPEGCSK